MQAILIKTIPHDLQRYETVGDYFTAALPDEIGGGLVRQFQISDLGNPDYEFLVALHELIESHLVQKRGISDQAIDDFDKQFERLRASGELPPGTGEPGDNMFAPYYREHQFATRIERLVARELGINWNKYERAVNAMSEGKPE